MTIKQAPKKKRTYVRARAAEPSSWAGLAAALLGAQQAYTATGGSKTAAVLAALGIVAGGVAMVKPDAKPDDAGDTRPMP